MRGALLVAGLGVALGVGGGSSAGAAACAAVALLLAMGSPGRRLQRRESSAAIQMRIIVSVLKRFRYKLFEGRVGAWGYPAHPAPAHPKFMTFDQAAAEVRGGDVVTLCGMAGPHPDGRGEGERYRAEPSAGHTGAAARGVCAWVCGCRVVARAAVLVG